MKTQITRPNVPSNQYVLILDAHGKPLAIAPLQQLRHNPFPTAQIRLVDTQSTSLEAQTELAPSYGGTVELLH
jgi:hypothetical protein